MLLSHIKARGLRHKNLVDQNGEPPQCVQDARHAAGGATRSYRAFLPKCGEREALEPPELVRSLHLSETFTVAVSNPPVLLPQVCI